MKKNIRITVTILTILLIFSLTCCEREKVINIGETMSDNCIMILPFSKVLENSTNIVVGEAVGTEDNYDILTGDEVFPGKKQNDLIVFKVIENVFGEIKEETIKVAFAGSGYFIENKDERQLYDPDDECRICRAQFVKNEKYLLILDRIEPVYGERDHYYYQYSMIRIPIDMFEESLIAGFPLFENTRVKLGIEVRNDYDLDVTFNSADEMIEYIKNNKTVSGRKLLSEASREEIIEQSKYFFKVKVKEETAVMRDTLTGKDIISEDLCEVLEVVKGEEISKGDKIYIDFRNDTVQKGDTVYAALSLYKSNDHETNNEETAYRNGYDVFKLNCREGVWADK